MSNNLSKTKEAYTNPETMTIDIAPRDSVLQDVSNPGGTVPPLDPDEG